MITLLQIKAELDLHFKQVDAIYPDIASYLPLTAETFTDVEKVKTLDSFILRFTKIQDKMGEKLFPVVLSELGEYKHNMSLIDVLHRLEKLEIIESSDDWLDFRKLRNNLAHEYPNNKKDIISAIHLAVKAYTKMKEIYFFTLKKQGENK